MYKVIDRYGNVQRTCETLKRAEKLCRKRKESHITMLQGNRWIMIKTSQDCKNERLT